MTQEVVIDLGAAVPVYEQIRSQLAGTIVSGRLPVGSKLPSVRALAADLGIAVNTVVRAYSELESSGLVANRRGSGARVAAVPDAQLAVAAAASRLASVATDAGMTIDRVIDLVRSAMLHARSRPAGAESADGQGAHGQAQ